MSMYPLRRILIAVCTLVALAGCTSAATDAPASEGSTDSTASTTDTGAAIEEGASPTVEGASPAVTGQAESDLTALVAAVNELAADQDVNDTTIDTVIRKLQDGGKIDQATWEVDTTPSSGTALKFAPGTDRETPYCITYVGIDPGPALEGSTGPAPSGSVRATFIVGKC